MSVPVDPARARTGTGRILKSRDSAPDLEEVRVHEVPGVHEVQVQVYWLVVFSFHQR